MNDDSNQIASNITSQLNKNLTFETNLIQPQYLLHRDTIKSFFYEKKDRLESSGKALAYFSIFLSTLISLLSSTFNDVWIIKANFLETIFLVTTIVSFGLFCRYIFSYNKYKKELEVDALTDELSKRSIASMISDHSQANNKLMES
jgi:hypothetical protein